MAHIIGTLVLNIRDQSLITVRKLGGGGGRGVDGSEVLPLQKVGAEIRFL